MLSYHLPVRCQVFTKTAELFFGGHLRDFSSKFTSGSTLQVVSNGSGHVGWISTEVSQFSRNALSFRIPDSSHYPDFHKSLDDSNSFRSQSRTPKQLKPQRKTNTDDLSIVATEHRFAQREILRKSNSNSNRKVLIFQKRLCSFRTMIRCSGE